MPALRPGTPATIEDINHHVAANYSSSHASRILGLRFEVARRPIKVRMKGNIAVSDAQAYVGSGLGGHWHYPGWAIHGAASLAVGLLVEILPRWKPLPMLTLPSIRKFANCH